MDVNLKGFLYAIAAVIPAMAEQGGGEIFVLGSETSADPLWHSTRAALEALVDETNHEFSRRSIRTTLVEERKPEQGARAIFEALRRTGDNAGKRNRAW